MVELYRVQKSTGQHFLFCNSEDQQSSKHAVFVTHLTTTSDDDLNSHGSKTCSELIWGYLYFILSGANIQNFCWKNIDVFLWLGVATPDKYTSFQNFKIWGKKYNPKHIVPYGLWERDCRFLLVLSLPSSS